MNNQLKLEVFPSTKQVSERAFHVYDLVSTNLTDNHYAVIKRACRGLTNYNANIGIFENGRQIFSTDEISNLPEKLGFKLNYQGNQLLPIDANKQVYEKYIIYAIKGQLKSVKVFDRYNKYSCKNEITSAWIKDSQGRYNIYKNFDESISLERKYSLRVTIGADGKAYLWINTSSVFVSQANVMDLINAGRNVYDLPVKNDWAVGRNQSGRITEITNYTVTDTLDWGSSLKEYYTNTKKEAYRVKDIPDNTPVVKMKMVYQTDSLPYYPQALVPIITREYLMQYDPAFSNKIDPLVKRNMQVRLAEDVDFINDIGELTAIDGLGFEKSCCDPQCIGYQYGIVRAPQLICANGNIIDLGEEYKVFSKGFYHKPEKTIKIGYMYPEGQYKLLNIVAAGIYAFAANGEYFRNNDPYTIANLIDIQKEPQYHEEYKLGDITEYKKAAQHLKERNDIDIVIAIIPDGVDEENPYSPFKQVWAEYNIPSQMITLSTAKLFWDNFCTGTSKAKYYLHNIVLGILGKVGGVPWIIKNMPAEVDCFVGLDVAMRDKGIHYPACSVVFDKFGRMIGFFKPKYAQRGEKITTDILQEIFDQVLISYENMHGAMPQNIVIHRDGFNNEDAKWYEQYFEEHNIKYSIIEVRKMGDIKMIDESHDDKNPPIGACIFNDNKAFLVTTLMKNKKGSPNPLIIEKSCGDLSMKDAVTQVLYLAQVHVGSTIKTRLPVTTGYADKICKNLDYVPAGQLENKLFFL